MFSEEDKEEQKKVEDEAQSLLKQLKDALTDRVEDVRISHRLTTSPSCIVLSEHDMALYMQQLMKQAGHDMPSSKPILEINPTHPLLVKMEAETDDEQVGMDHLEKSLPKIHRLVCPIIRYQ